MTRTEPTGTIPDAYCERVRLLLSLAVDGETTTDQQAEVDAHLPGCEPCRRARAADLAIRAHMEATLATLPPGQLAGVVLARARLEARAASRFLLISAAAAVLVAVAAGLASGGARHSAPAAVAAGDAQVRLTQARSRMQLALPVRLPGATDRR